MFAKAGPSGEPIAMPSICRCMLLLKLNSTEEVANCINSTKMLHGKDGAIESSFVKDISTDFYGFSKLLEICADALYNDDSMAPSFPRNIFVELIAVSHLLCGI